MANRKRSPRRRTRAAGRTSRPATVAPAIRYVESSALVAALLEGDDAAKVSVRAQGRRITSALTLAETSRAILRARLSGRITAQQQRAALLTVQTFARRSYLVSITTAILAQAGRPFPVEPIRTLDAIHLATAAALGEPSLVTIITRDVRIRDNAVALGHAVE